MGNNEVHYTSLFFVSNLIVIQKHCEHFMYVMLLKMV